MVPRLCVLAGSLRSGSCNRGVARVLVAAGAEPVDIDDLPLFSQDYERRDREPSCAAAQRLRMQLRSADGVLLVTPEYDSYPSGVMINAMNWCSRPPDWPLNRKPVAVLSASTGARGGRRAQHHLRQMLERMGARLVEPMLCIDARQGFDQDGSVVDPAIKQAVRDQLGLLSQLIASQS